MSTARPAILPCKAKRQYLLTLQGSRYWLFWLYRTAYIFTAPRTAMRTGQKGLSICPSFCSPLLFSSATLSVLGVIQIGRIFHFTEWHIPANTMRWPNVGLMLGQRRRHPRAVILRALMSTIVVFLYCISTCVTRLFLKMR